VKSPGRRSGRLSHRGALIAGSFTVGPPVHAGGLFLAGRSVGADAVAGNQPENLRQHAKSS